MEKDNLTKYEDDVLHIEFLQDKGYILEKWKKFADNKQIEFGKLKFIDILKANKCFSYLSDLTFFTGALPESQIWVRDVWLPEIIKLGIKNIAIIEHNDMFVNYSLNQVLIDKNVELLNIKRFNKFIDAETWITGI